jgi:hypothetical protein
MVSSQFTHTGLSKNCNAGEAVRLSGYYAFKLWHISTGYESRIIKREIQITIMKLTIAKEI